MTSFRLKDLPSTLFSGRHTTGTLVQIGAALFTTGYLLRSAWANYRGYLALGQGGLPHNVLGWILQGAAQLVAKWDTRSAEPFSRPAIRQALGEHGTRRFLLGLGDKGESAGTTTTTLGERKGGQRPNVPGYVAPQRQTDQFPPAGGSTTENGGKAGMRERMEDVLEKVVGANPGVLVLKPSALEGVGTPAIWLDDSPSSSSSPLPAFMKGLKGEMAHVHPECSSHVTLSMADAEEVVTKGWAERHRLSGVGGLLPWSYVLVYAPRDEEELAVWKGIMKAGVRFVCAAAEREVAVDGV